MKCNQYRPGFELVSPCSFPTAITTTPRAGLGSDGREELYDVELFESGPLFILNFPKPTDSIHRVFPPVISGFCFKDSFSFSEIIRNFIPTDMCMCSFDVCSLYTSIPLEETIKICRKSYFVVRFLNLTLL